MSAFGGKADIIDGAEKGRITVIQVLGLSLVCLATKIRRDRSEKICRRPGSGLIENASHPPPGGSAPYLTTALRTTCTGMKVAPEGHGAELETEERSTPK